MSVPALRLRPAWAALGFAVGRTVFWDPVADWRAGKVAPNAAVDEIARCYREFVTVFESASSPAATRTDA